MAKVGDFQEVFGVRMGYLDPQSLTPNPLNYQTHPERQREAIAASIEEHGWVAFPIYNLRTKRLVDGHARIEDAARRGLAAVPCVVVEMDEKQEKRLLASFDRIGRLATHNEAILARLLSDIADEGPMPAGWSEDELGDLLMKLNRDAENPLGGEGASATATATAGTGNGEGVEAGGTPTPSHVRMVQLFLNTETEPEFKEWVQDLQARYGTENLTDTVYEAVRRETQLFEGDPDEV